MGAIVALGSAVWTAIASVTAAIALVVTTIATVLVTVVSTLAVFIGSTVAAISTTIGSWIATSAKVVWTGIKAIGATIKEISIATYTHAKDFITVIKTKWTAFSEFIHLEAIIKIHNIGLVLSPSYRQAVVKLYYSIGQVSQAVGLGVATMNIILRNTRSIVLDTSALLGMPYDLAETQWLTQFSKFLNRFEDQARLYGDYPHYFFRDLDELFTEDAINTKASTMQTVYSTIDKTLDGLTSVVTGVDKVNDDLKNLVGSLPENIREKVEQYTKPFTDKVDNFIDTQYLPAVDQLNQVVNILSNTQTQYQNKFDGLVERIKRPAHYLKEIDSLSLPEKTEQENIIGEIAGRSRSRVTDVMLYETKQLETHIDQVIELQSQPVTPNTWEVKEQEEPNPLPQSEQGKENTWFVGEF